MNTLKRMVSSTVDGKTRAKIDIAKQRMIKQCSYNQIRAIDVLNNVASILASGDSQDGGRA